MTSHTLEHTHTHTHRYSEQSNRVVNNRPDPILKEKRPKRESADLWTQLRGAVVYVSRRVQLMKMCCEPEDATSFRAKWSENQIQFHDLWNAIGYEKEAKRWIKCAHSRSGRMYYFNLITEESSWTKPSVIALYETIKHRMGVAHIIRRHLREQLAEGKTPRLENVPHAVLNSNLLTDMFVEEEHDEEFHELRHRVEDGSIRAAIVLARSCLEGFCESSNNTQIACKLLELCAKRGCPKAQAMIATLHVDPARADQWAATALDNGLEDAAHDGHPIARLVLGMMLQNGIGVGSKNYRAAAQMYESVLNDSPHCSSRKVVAEASCRLAWCYRHGHGTVQNLPRAVKLYRVAIREANMLEALESLASILESHPSRDETVCVDDDEASRLWRLAASRGSAIAMVHYGQILLHQIEDDESVDASADTFLAATLFAHAMRRGHEGALDALKTMVANGKSRKGVGEDALRDMIHNVKLPELDLGLERKKEADFRGVGHRNHVLVSYERSDSGLSSAVRDVMKKLTDKGFRVRSVVCSRAYIMLTQITRISLTSNHKNITRKSTLEHRYVRLHQNQIKSIK